MDDDPDDLMEAEARPSSPLLIQTHMTPACRSQRPLTGVNEILHEWV